MRLQMRYDERALNLDFLHGCCCDARNENPALRRHDIHPSDY